MSRSYLTTGNVVPSRFVKLDTAQIKGYVLQAGATDTPIGVAQQGVRQAPIAGFDDGYAAVAQVNHLGVYEAEDECLLEIGAAVGFGDYLKPSTGGVAITAGSDGDIYGAIALESGTASGQLIRARVLAPAFRGA